MLSVNNGLSITNIQCTWALLLRFSLLTFLNILRTLDFFFSRSWKTTPFRTASDLIKMLLTKHSRWLMGLIERLALMLTGVSILIPFIKQFILGSNFLFHHFSVVFRDLFSLLLCSKPSNGTLIQFIDINHTCREKDIVCINIST